MRILVCVYTLNSMLHTGVYTCVGVIYCVCAAAPAAAMETPAGSPPLASSSIILHAHHRAINTNGERARCGMRDAGCGMRDAGCGIRDAGGLICGACVYHEDICAPEE